MFKKGSKLYGIIKGVCPKCHNETMYKDPNIFSLRVLIMNERCSHCNTKYAIEPSFFYGSMYISYGVGIAFAIAAFLVSFFLLNLGLMSTFLVIVATLVVFMTVIMRISRNIWINLFMSYDKALDKKSK